MMTDDRFTRAKERWREKQLARGARKRDEAAPGRLPPGQRLVKNFPVLDLGRQPEVSQADWRLTVDGKVDRPAEWTWEEFLALGQVEDVSDFHCVTTWSKYDCRWEGVPFTAIYEAVAPRPEATHVFFRGYDGYTANVPLEKLLAEGVLVATRFDGAPLPREHGGPARVIIPHLYAWKGAKWVRQITFLPQDLLGYWELRGYSNTADPWTEDRFA